MSHYTYCDTNIFGDCNDECDISGEKYTELLKICFKYSSTFSFIIFGENKYKVLNGIPEALSPYEIEIEDYVVDNYRGYSRKITKHYKVCPEIFDIVLGMNDSIFKWINNYCYSKPEDIAFFREDGSVFLSSSIHNGECSLFPRKDEDISSLLELDNWYFIDDENRWFKV